MKWFKHYSNAHDNNKLTKVRMKYGADGYAIYWYCLELIAHDLESENITFELKHDSEVIAYNLKIDSQRVQEIMAYMVNLGLFEVSNNVITCLKIAKYLDAKYTRNKDLLKIIADTKNVPDNRGQMPTCPRLSPTVSPLSANVPTRIEKNRIEKKKKKTLGKKFIKPTIEEIRAYCQERKNHVNPNRFYDFYESKDWYVGKNKMKNWKAAIRTWEQSTKSEQVEIIDAI